MKASSAGQIQHIPLLQRVFAPSCPNPARYRRHEHLAKKTRLKLSGGSAGVDQRHMRGQLKIPHRRRQASVADGLAGQDLLVDGAMALLLTSLLAAVDAANCSGLPKTDPSTRAGGMPRRKRSIAYSIRHTRCWRAHHIPATSSARPHAISPSLAGQPLRLVAL